MKTLLAVKVVVVLSLLGLPALAAPGTVPQAPTNLTGTVQSPTAIELNWVDNSIDETSFRIERSLDGVLFSQLSTTVADVTTYVDTTANQDTLYYYRVFAVNLNGDSNPSNVISKYTLDTVAPPAPVLTTPPNGDQLNTHNVRFQWNPVSDMSGVTYRIVVNDLSNAITLHDVSGITATNISLLLYDSTYEWNVTATDGAGNTGPASGSYYFLVVAIDHLAPDTTVTAPNGGEVLVAGTSFAITWYALDQDFTSTPNLKVRIYFSHDNGSSWEQIASLGNNPGAYDWTVPNVLCDATCLIRVTTENQFQMLGSDDSDFAFSIVAPSPPSPGGDTVSPQTNPPGGNPAAPNNAPSAPALVFPENGQTGLATDLTCRWKKSQDPDGDAVTYRVYYCTDPNFGNCPPVTVANLGAPKAFYATAGSGLLLMGGIFVIPRSARKKLLLLMIALIMVGGAVVSCSRGGGEDGNVAPNITPTAADELSYPMSGLSAGATYYWKVVADDGKGGIVESAVWSFTTQ